MMINYKLEWSPGYLQYQNGGETFFIGESDIQIGVTRNLVDLQVAIADGQLLSDYVYKDNNIAYQISRINTATSLRQVGILADHNKALKYFGPGNNYAGVGWMPISAQNNLQYNYWYITDLPAQTGAQAGIDYSKDQRPVVLIKPFGAQPSVGPVFKSDLTGPCTCCLHTRLVANHPVRDWHSRQLNLPSLAELPVLDQTNNQQKIAGLFQQHLQRVQNEPALEATIFQLDAQLISGRLHQVAKLPQCPECGDPALIKRTFEAPINLQDVIPQSDQDGGYRQEARELTLAKILPLISPLCGVISELKELTSADDSQLSIYQASYNQNTYSAATPTADTFVQLSLGKGVSKLQAQLSALGEALERKAAQYTGEEAIILAAPDMLNGRSYLPQQLAPFSPDQYDLFASLGAPSLLEPQVVQSYDATSSMHWCPGWSLTKHERVFFPAAFCLASTPFEDAAYSLYTHNGNSAGNTQEEAILQGALELIERDATAIWWYNQVPRPGIALEVIECTAREVINNTLASEWDYWLLDISHDIPVVVCAAVGQHRQTGKFVLGFGCHLDVAIAAQRALTEMYQLICIKDKVSGPFDFDAITPHPFLFPRNNTPIKTSVDFASAKIINIKHAILHLVESLQQKGMEMCVINYSRPDIPLLTLKVVVPGLCHFWPQLANGRLYGVPVELGWLSYALAETEINPQALYL